MYELFNNSNHGSGANVWSYFWEIVDTCELGNEVFSNNNNNNNNNNNSNKSIISLWIAAFHCLNMALGTDIGYHWMSAAEKYLSNACT